MLETFRLIVMMKGFAKFSQSLVMLLVQKWLWIAKQAAAAALALLKWIVVTKQMLQLKRLMVLSLMAAICV